MPYDGPDGFLAWMNAFAAANPDLVKLEVIGHTWGTDPEGGADTPRDIVALKVTLDASTEADGSRPAVLYSSLQHAREWISGEVNRRLLTWFVRKYRQGDQAISRLLGSTELRFVPVANPDGYQYTFDHARLWRKNLRDNDGDGLITAVDGVDPNRNFPEHWNYDDEGSASTTADETYRGPAPTSEPETQAMVGLIDRVPFRFLVNYHSFAREILTAFGWQVETPSADDPILVALSGTDRHPVIAGFDPGVGADLYVTNGETTDFAHAHGTLAWTVELDGEGRRVRLPGRSGPRSKGVRQEPPGRAQRGPVGGRSSRSGLIRGDHDEALLSGHVERRSTVSAQPAQRLHVRCPYGRSEPVEVLARRDIDGDGAEDPVTVHGRVNGGAATHTDIRMEWW